MFTQIATTTPGTDGALYAHIQCFACKGKGHYADMCPKGNAVQLFQSEVGGLCDPENLPACKFTFTSIGTHETLIPKTWVLLNSQSTVSVFVILNC